MKTAVTRNMGQISQRDLLKNMVTHLNNYGFWQASCHPKTLGCNGELVKSYIKNEWMLSNLIWADEPVFKASVTVENVFTYCRRISEKLPFSVISNEHVVESNSEKQLCNEYEIESYFNPKTYTVLKKTVFCSPEESTAYFHKLQRERKIWWRKFSALPGRFSFTEVTSKESNREQHVEIQANFPWKQEQVETVRCITELPFRNADAFLIKEGRRNVLPHVVTSEFRLEVAASVYICDAYEKINEDTNRDIMRFHRKLAPFKIAFAASASSSNTAKELSDLALVLARKVRKYGIGCLLLPDLTKCSLESQFQRNDAMGIPYSIVLNDKTLQEGMIGIRSRDTTLKEQSHVGIVVSYIEKIMKSY